MKYLIPFHDFLNESKLEDIYTKYYADIESKTFTQIISADPTTIVKHDEVVKMGSYSKWLLSLYKTNSLKLEDLYKATDYLTSFDKLKNRKVLSGQQADILSFKSLPDLFQTISEVGGTGKPTEDENYLIEDRFFVNNGQAEVHAEDSDYLIVVPRTLEASNFYGKGSQWCTLYPDMFKEYSEKGTLYIIIDKHKLNSSASNRRLQFHFEEAQFMNFYDKPLNIKAESRLIRYFTEGIQPIHFKYKVGKVTEGMARIERSRKYGFVDIDGRVVIPAQYNNVGYFSQGLAFVRANGKYGFVDKQGNEVIALKYDYAYDFSEGRGAVSLNGKYGFVDKQGNEVIPLKYDGTYGFSEGLAGVSLNKKYGFINTKGIEVIPLIYDRVQNFGEGHSIVENNGMFGCINLKGKIIIPIKYEGVWDYEHNMVMVRLNGKVGIVDLRGNEIIPVKYTEIRDFKDGKARVYLNSKWGSVDLQGNEFWD
jgi:hypothetical protein